MEEEYFFYYLTPGSEATRTVWDDEHENGTQISGITSTQPMEEKSVNTNADQGLNGLPSTTTNTNPTQGETTRLLSNQELSVASDTSFLLPPMNGTVNYSNLKGGSSLPSSLQNSRHGYTGPLSGGSLHNASVHGLMSPTLERGDSFFKPLSRKSSSFFEPLSRRASSFIEPFNDHTGRPESVIAGLFNLLVVGTLVGVAMPKNESLPTPWYRYLSSIVGYSYFIFWCASFYPQIVMNFQRKSTAGLSIDYSVINFFGYICYTSYTSAFYWDESVKQMYRERHAHDNVGGAPSEITVESNDVAFAIHALIMSIIWLFQLEIYGGFEQCRKQGKRIISRPITILIYLIIGSCSIYAGLILYLQKPFGKYSLEYVSSYLNWLDYLYFLSFLKVIITIAKYIPQVLMNMKRRSCVGWNVWNILLDITGGILSLVQLVGDAYDLNDMSSIAGNSAKLGLSAVSIIFDVSYNFNFLFLNILILHT